MEPCPKPAQREPCNPRREDGTTRLFFSGSIRQTPAPIPAFRGRGLAVTTKRIQHQESFFRLRARVVNTHARRLDRDDPRFSIFGSSLAALFRAAGWPSQPLGCLAPALALFGHQAGRSVALDVL